MRDDIFTARLQKYCGQYKEVAAGSGVGYELVRRYAAGYVPKYKRENVQKIIEWMRGRKP